MASHRALRYMIALSAMFAAGPAAAIDLARLVEQQLSVRLEGLSETKRGELIKAIDQQSRQLKEEKTAVRTDQTITPAAAQAKLKEIQRAEGGLQDTKGVLMGAGAPTAPERMQAVDETIRWYTRPIWVVCNGEPWFPAADIQGQAYIDFRPLVEPRTDVLRQAGRATGLITVYDKSDGVHREKARGPLATAVAISDNRIVTNKHVLTDGNIAFKDESQNTWTLWDTLVVKVEFPFEYDHCSQRSGIKQVVVQRVVYADDLDFAILETESGLPESITFADDDDVQGGDRVVVVGYPSRPPDGKTPLSPLQIDKVFSAPNQRTPFPAERMAAGSVFRDQTIADGYFAHDASTWGGNSGSLVINLATGKFVGLHARGLESKNEGVAYNEAVSGSRIAKVVSELKSKTQGGGHNDAGSGTPVASGSYDVAVSDPGGLAHR